ncbi:ceramidase [Gigaspora rosea]|uniref:Ceramidase n=1 Tax=Gigaspora rosea TaxID=44941 RepID=A0A397VNV7_9GLOM|nr:ceramidase [Gigaspora rosea]
MNSFWGKPTSTVDWCEKNYEVSYYIAEFFNTLSSLCLICAGIFGFIMHSKGFDHRFKLGFGTIIFIGIGSIIFHGTLLYPFEHFDGTPMVFYLLILFYSINENKKERKYGNWFPIVLFLWGLIFSIMLIVLGKYYENQIIKLVEFYIFQGSFLLMAVYVYLRVIAIVINLKNEKGIVALMIRGTIIFLIGYIGWNIDYHFCSEMNNILNPQLHAWWHVTASYSCYSLHIIVIFDRSKILGKNPKIKWVCIILPYVGLSDESEQNLPTKVMSSAERKLIVQEVSVKD